MIIYTYAYSCLFLHVHPCVEVVFLCNAKKSFNQIKHNKFMRLLQQNLKLKRINRVKIALTLNFINCHDKALKVNTCPPFIPIIKFY